MKIKRLNEQLYFTQSFSGDGYNSSNGVFKVNYKPYSDLSITKGRDPIPFYHVKGEEFHIGDLVKAKIRGSLKNVIGTIISAAKNNDASEYIFRVKSSKSNRIYEIITSTMEHYTNISFGSKTNNIIASRGKLANDLKYDSGNLVWGKLESNNASRGDILLTSDGKKLSRKGILDNTLSLSLVTSEDPNISIHQERFKELGIAYLDTKSRTIYIDSTSPNFQMLSDDHLITIEAHELAHNIISGKFDKDVEILCDLLAAKILRNKGYNSAYKIIISNFLGRHKSSYGECLDLHDGKLNFEI